MPRTKQNNPRNLKDKIEEAQKELKDPKDPQKDFAAAGRRAADVKGLKRKKVVAENQLKEIRKSPVKKSLQSKPRNAAPPRSQENLPRPPSSGSPPHDPSPSPSSKEEPRHEQPVAAPPDEGPRCPDAEGVKPDRDSSRPASPPNGEEPPAEETPPTDNASPEGGFKESYYGGAPLDVLLKAMEPDFSTLADRKPPLQAAAGNPAPPPQLAGVGPQTAHMQTYYIDKQGNVIRIAAAPQGSVHTTAQGAAPLAAPHFMAMASNPDKQSLQVNFKTGPSVLSHAPTPPGSKALPQSQPPVVHTCQSLAASVPSSVQVPVTPGGNHVQLTAVVNFGVEPASREKPKKPGKYVCEYCQRACAKPSVLLKHIRSHTGERPYPCVTCGFSFKTKSNLYKHKKSHAHAIKLGLMARESSGGGSCSLSQESDKGGAGTHSEAEDSGDSDEDAADLDPDSSQSLTAASSESSLLSAVAAATTAPEVEPSLKSSPGRTATAALPKVVVYPVNVSPLRADSPRVTGAAPEQAAAAAQRQREIQTAALRSNITVLSSLREVDAADPSLEALASEDEDQRCRSPALGHAQLQRQQATDSQQPKCLLSPRSLGSTDSGYFSRSESADQAMSPPSPFVKITPPTEVAPVVAAVMHAATRQMRPPLDASARSLEEHISKLISDNEALVDDKQLDSVKPRRTSLSRRGSIDSPKSYIFKDSFQFDLKPMARRSSSSSDIPRSPFTPTDKSKPVLLLSVPGQYPAMDCLPITRSNSMPTTRDSVPPLSLAHLPHPLRGCQSFDDKISSLNDDVFASAPSTPGAAGFHSRTLVRQKAVDDFSTAGDGLPTARSMDEGIRGPGSAAASEPVQRTRSFEHGQDRLRRPQQNKGTMYECETCRNRYRKLENFETHKKFYCSELHGPKNKPAVVREPEPDVFRGAAGLGPGTLDHQTSIRKRRKMKSVGDEDDQSPTDTAAPCSVSFEAPPKSFSQHALGADAPPKSNPSKLPQLQLVARGMSAPESRLSPIRETQTNSPPKADLPRPGGGGTSVIRHTNSLSRPSSFETETPDRVPADPKEKDPPSKAGADGPPSADSAFHDKPAGGEKKKERGGDGGTGGSTTPVHQSRLVRQSNIQVPEILVTEDSDREHEAPAAEAADKQPADPFSWPQRSESLSKLPTEKLPPKKKRIRLAGMDQSSAESSFESSVSRSLSRDSSLSRCSSVSASFDRDEPLRAESPSRGDGAAKAAAAEVPVNTLGVPGAMRRAASEQITCTQPSVEICGDYRSKSFDCGHVSPSRSLSRPGPAPQVPPAVSLIERRRGPLVRQMSLKIGPENQPPVRKPGAPPEKPLAALVSSFPQNRSQQIHIASRRPAAPPFVLAPSEPPTRQDEQVVQSINLGSAALQPQVHGLPHPWHQTSRVQLLPKLQPPLTQISVPPSKRAEPEERKSFVPKYQLQCPAPRAGQNSFSFSCTQAARIALPILTIPIANPLQPSVLQNLFVGQQNSEVKTVVLQRKESVPVPQILITHEQMHPAPSLCGKHGPAKPDPPAPPAGPDPGPGPGAAGSLASVTLCPQQEPAASSKRMLSPANSLDIYMEKHQKRAKDEHGGACPPDSRPVSYVEAATRQRKLTLVRQVCTTEPADSPLETEAPALPDVRPDAARDSEDDAKPMSPDGAGLEKDRTEIRDAAPVTRAASPKGEDQRWTPARSLIRPSSFHGGPARPTTAVSVVSTRDPHRLSFPSLKTATTFTWCFLMKRRPLHLPQADHKTSAYAAWAVAAHNPNPLGLPTKVVMSLFQSRQSAKKVHYTSAIRTGGAADILSYSGKLKDVMPKVPVTQKPGSAGSAEARRKPQPEPQSSNDSDKDASTEPRRVKIFDGGFKSNEDYIYVRGRGRGKYICEECGIRCKKPSMLRKHIRTHSDVRPYHCVHCSFSFKTKGNLTKHMKSKAHRKKCLEMGVPEGFVEDQDAEDSGDRSQLSADRQDSDGDESDGGEDEDNEDEDEDEESSPSTNPSVAASPQHLPPRDTGVPPSALLAQMSISAYLPSRARTPDPVPFLESRCGADPYASDPESVHMMSPVSPCRQMSIDYPDVDAPFSPPYRLSQVSQDSCTAVAVVSSDLSAVDRGTQTSSYTCVVAPPPLAPPPETRLFSHLPLHSQGPRPSYGVLPVGGVQLVPAGLATFLTIPAVGVIHRNSSPAPATPPRAPEPLSSVVPCFPLGPVGPVGLETFNLMGLANAGLASAPGLTLNALGLQVLAASPAPQGAGSAPTHVPGLQILNIALPAIIPALSPAPGSLDRQGSPEAPPPPQAPPPAPPVRVAPARGATPELTPVSRPEDAPEREESPPRSHAPPPAAPPPALAAPARSWQTVINADNEVSSDDEDRLVIAT
ncbi:zinc finger protein 40 [Cololabis saira]|uniref:zinc finger protein 40 n=1 Tax=Cololabis saira TaxID=129043 RepID=UPI002AD54BF7|nr:zinc finger protein 40 [Cololabis saira]XP_061597202.1 zinc finger protein 40 [Cololabis saira]